MPGPGRLSRALRLAALALAAGVFLFRLALLRRHAFNPDEFQHLHGAWCIAKGLLPYRDYFEHHTPWLHFFLAAFLGLFDADTNPAQAEAFVLFARGSMWVFSGLALAAAWWLGRLWDGDDTASVGLALLATSVMFLDKTLEIRPDVPALAFLLGSWAVLLRAARDEGGRRGVRLAFAQAGVLLAAALLCTQKALFTLPASVLWLSWYVVEARTAEARKERLACAGWHAAGVAAPLLAVLGLFALRGGLAAFVECNLLVNLRWPVRFSPAPVLRQLVHENALLMGLGLLGLAACAVEIVRDGARGAGRALVPLHALGLGAGFFLIPVPYAQYLVMLLPLVALLAGGVLVRAIRAASRLPFRPARAATLAAIALVVMAWSLRPVRLIAAMRQPPHTKVEDQLEGLRHVVERTRPDARFLDGFSGLGTFRPHAYRHFFLHDEVRALLAGREMTRLLAALRDGTVAPDWVVADGDVRALPRGVVAFLEENYEPEERAPLWRLKESWLDQGAWIDLGTAPGDLLAGRGWQGADRDGTVAFRRGRGAFSTVRLPAREPARCRAVVVRARREGPGEATAELALNGRAIGSLRFGEAWTDQAVPIPRGVLQRGINALRLSYGRPVEPSGSDPWPPVAVDGVGLACDRAPR